MDHDAAPERALFKAQQTTHWNDVAAGWAARAEWTERNFAPLTSWLCAAAWRPGSRVLDLACGSGYPTIAAAQAVGPTGHVVGADISPEMLAAAASRARAVGLANIEFIEQDSEALRFDADSFDAVTHTYGLMFCPNLERAVSEMRRVLRPGGCAAVVVWDEPQKSPYFDLFFTGGGQLLGLAPPTPGAPGPFRLAAPGTLAALFQSVGFDDVRVETLAMIFECESVEDYIQMFGDFAFKSRLARLTDADRVRLRAEVASLVNPYVDDRGHIQLLTTSLCGLGRK